MIRIYTDGACKGNPGPGGWAAIIVFDDTHEILSGGCDATTNNRMELYAVISALRYIYRRGAEHVTIYSDSAYVVNAITKGWLNNWAASDWRRKNYNDEPIKNEDLWRIAHNYLQKLATKVKFIKVKGHSGNVYNEMADEKAVIEAKQRQC